jgi:hypothetical protein
MRGRMGGMNHVLGKLLFRIAGAAIFCGGVFASGLLDHVSSSDKALFTGLLIAFISLASFGVEAICERAQYQFSLRAMLIVMTIAALLLGLVGLATR